MGVVSWNIYREDQEPFMVDANGCYFMRKAWFYKKLDGDVEILNIRGDRILYTKVGEERNLKIEVHPKCCICPKHRPSDKVVIHFKFYQHDSLGRLEWANLGDE